MMAPTRMSVLYFLLGQAGWFACVVSAAHGSPMLGVMVVIILVAAHLLRVARAREEGKLLAFAMLLGAFWDSMLVRLGLLGYPSGTLASGFAPVWIVALWVLFGGQINTSYTWLKGRPVIAAVFGALAGPLSFRAGAGLGAVQFIRPLPATITLAVGWAVILPLLVSAARRWDGVRPGSPP